MPFHFNGYTNMHDLNLDWVTSMIKSIENAEADTAESAEAAAASAEAAAQSAEQSAESAEAAATDAASLAGKAEQVDLNTARINNILVQGTPTEGNAELIDIRVGFNGVTYSTAGESVRTQAGILKNSTPALDQSLTTVIAENTDLDTIMNLGSYKIETNTITATLLNKPTRFNSAGRLFVMTAQQSARRLQFIVSGEQQPKTWIRYHNGSRWFDWCETVNNAADFATLNYAETVPVADINALRTPGNYVIDSNTVGAPEGFLQGRMFMMSTTQTSGRHLQIAFNTEYEKVKMYARYFNGTGWDAWREFAYTDDLNLIMAGRLDTIDWTISTLASGHPAEVGSASYNKRILSDFILVGKGTKISSISPYDYYVAHYDLQKTYQGYLFNGWRNAVETEVPDDSYIRLIIRKHDDSVIEESEVSEMVANVNMEYIPPTFYTFTKTENDIPAYYNDQLSTAVNTIRANMNAGGKNSDTFIFITDTHWDPRVLYRNRNARRSPALVKKIVAETGIKKIIFGGDYFTGNDSPEFEFEQLHDFFNAFDIKNTLTYPIMGNHDWNHYNTPTGQWDDNTAYAQIMKQCEMYVNMGDDLCYYFDNAAAQTRYIMLNSHDQNQSIPAAQLTWFQNVLNSTPAGYRIIIVMHVWFNTVDNVPTISNQNSQVSAICDDFNTNNADRKVKAMFGGHIHYDYVSATPGGIPIVITDTDAYLSAVGSSPEIDTIDEQCFDIITVDYTNNTIKCVRIGRGENRTVNMQ